MLHTTFLILRKDYIFITDVGILSTDRSNFYRGVVKQNFFQAIEQGASHNFFRHFPIFL